MVFRFDIGGVRFMLFVMNKLALNVYYFISVTRLRMNVHAPCPFRMHTEVGDAGNLHRYVHMSMAAHQ